LRLTAGRIEDPASRRYAPNSSARVGYSNATWFSRHRRRLVGLGHVEHADAVMALVHLQEARAVVGGLDADLGLEHVQVPLLHHLVVGGVQDQVRDRR
jgi:hypothetical protein